MPTCTPQLCFGKTGPSYNPEPDYGAYTLNPGLINMGKTVVSDTFVMFGEWTRPEPIWQYGAQYKEGDIAMYMKKLQNNPSTQKFTLLTDTEIDDQIKEQLSGDGSTEVEQEMITEIRNKLKNLMTDGKIMKQVNAQIVYAVGGEGPSRADKYNLKAENAKGYIDTYTKIKTGRLKAPWGQNRTLEYPVNFVYSVKIQLAASAICKKLDDQFNMYAGGEPDPSALDPKWQAAMQPAAEILDAYCVSVDLALSAATALTAALKDENFIPSAEVPAYIQSVVFANYRVIGPKSKTITGPLFREIINQAASQQHRGNMVAGIFGGGSWADQAFGWATTHLSLDGPLVQGGISVPYLIDESGNITWDYHFYYSFGLNEAYQLAQDPQGYLNTVLQNAGYLQQNDSTNIVTQYLGGQGTETVTETHLDLNGQTTSPNTGRETGGGSPIDSSGQGGNASPRPGGLDSIRNRATRVF